MLLRSPSSLRKERLPQESSRHVAGIKTISCLVLPALVQIHFHGSGTTKIDPEIQDEEMF